MRVDFSTRVGAAFAVRTNSGPIVGSTFSSDARGPPPRMLCSRSRAHRELPAPYSAPREFRFAAVPLARFRRAGRGRLLALGGLPRVFELPGKAGLGART